MSAEPIVLAGAGALADALGRALAAVGPVVRSDDVDAMLRAPLVVSASDLPSVARFKDLDARLYARGVAHLPAWIEFGEARLGPLVAGTPGCLRCAETRRMTAHPVKNYYAAAMEKSTASSAGAASLAVVAAIAAAEVTRFGDGRPVLAGRTFLVDLDTLESSTHRFTPDPTCAVCGAIPDDTAERAAIALAASRPALPGGWRVADYGGRHGELAEALVDARSGIATSLGVDITTSFCAVGSARFGCVSVQREEWGAGLTMSAARSRAVALLEVLERYAGLRPRGKTTTVRASYAELGGDALDPRSLILYADEEYARPKYPCVRCRDDLVMNWRWAWSFARERAILVPEQAAFYDATNVAREELFLIESSSGCATGGCIEEAVFHGLLEAIERDGVLRTWYSMAPPRHLDPATVRGRDLQLMIDRLTTVSGYRLAVIDATQETGIPVIWAMAVKDGDAEHRSLSTSRAHPDAETALAGALGELMGTLVYQRQQCVTRRGELLAMLGDSDRVLDRLDHSLLAGLPEAFERLSFLFEREAEAVPFAAAYPDGHAGWGRDLAVAARELIALVLRRGYDVIAVDQTTPEQRGFGLATVKVLVPGMLPMTYCHAMRRTPRRPRNPWPHPFA